MNSFENQVLLTIWENNLISDKSKILAAVSGGPDSTALLCFLYKHFPENLIGAAYVDHKLRPEETGAEITHVKALCNKSNIAIFSTSVDVRGEVAKTGESPEDCARRLRYRYLRSLMQEQGFDLVATGHTGDDQAEEILIRIIRGSGATGLAGMALRNKNIIRPFLQVSKEDVLSFLESENLPYCIDSSNMSREFLRNRVRIDLIPMLEKHFNPSIRKGLQNLAAILGEEDTFVENKARQYYEDIVSEVWDEDDRKILSYPVEKFTTIHRALQRRIIEQSCWRSGCRPTFVIIESIVKLSVSGKTGSELHLPNGVKVIRTTTEMLFIRRPEDQGKRYRPKEAANEEETIIESVGTYPLPSCACALSIEKSSDCDPVCADGLVIDADKVVFPLILRAPLPGETFRPLGAPGRKKVARFLSDRKIPQHTRHRYPVLIAQDEIIAIPGIILSDHVKLTEDTSQCLIIKMG